MKCINTHLMEHTDMHTESKVVDVDVEAYMKSEKNRKYYEITIEEEYCGEFSRYESYSDDELAQIKKMKSESDDDCEFIGDFCDRHFDVTTLPADCYVVGIDTETVYYPCRFKVADFFDGLSNPPTVNDNSIMLTADQYAYLLRWRIAMGEIGFDSLIYSNKDLYNEIRHQLSDRSKAGGVAYSPSTPAMVAPSFAIEDSELIEAARCIVQKGCLKE